MVKSANLEKTKLSTNNMTSTQIVRYPNPTKEDTSSNLYLVLKNHEEQYSIWPDCKPIPKGWQQEGEAKLKADCLSYINDVWIDMRPLSLRKEMTRLQKEKQQALEQT